MYKILLVFSSVVYNDKTYCLYALVNKEDNEHLLCVAELNLEHMKVNGYILWQMQY